MTVNERPAPLEIAFAQADGSMTSIQFDAVVHEQHVGANDITEHAVERGGNVSDHVRPQLARLSIEFVVSNTPITQPATHMMGVQMRPTPVDLPGGAATNVLQADGFVDRRQAVYDELVGLMERGTVCTILTEIRGYDNMVLAGLEITRDVASAESLEGTIDAKQVRLVEAAVTSAVPVPREPRARARRNRGTQATTDEADGSPGQSLASRALGALGL